MTWHFLADGFNTGKYNMEYDLYLANNCKMEEAFLRLYRWKPYCISLGANQDVKAINAERAQKDNVDIVVRPTGGRAILHAEELTYSVVMPLDDTSSVRNIYNEINSAILAGLEIYDPGLVSAELENIQPDFTSFYKDDISAACFAASAKSEIKYTGKKLVGSAQRKLTDSVLQHGSILCGSYHTHITEYFNLSSEASKRIYKQMIEKTTDISSILGSEVDYNRLQQSIAEGFENYFKNQFATKTI